MDVTPAGGATPTAQCDAPVIDGKLQLPLNTPVTIVETGAYTEVRNVEWGGVTWGVRDGSAEVTALEGEAAGATVVLTGGSDEDVTLDLVNATSSRGLVLLPLPIPLPPFEGSSTTPGDTPVDPVTPVQPDRPVQPNRPTTPGEPVLPDRPVVADATGHTGAPGQPSPATVAAAGPSKPEDATLALTGANVAWLTAAALAFLAGGAWLVIRGRREETVTE